MTRNWLSWVLSNDKVIIDVLEDQTKNLAKATSSLVELNTHYDRATESKSMIRDLEREGGEITHNLFTIIDRTFITPLDREDILRLTIAIDEILDYTDGTAARFSLYKIQKSMPYMLVLAKVFLSASQEVSEMITRIRNLKNAIYMKSLKVLLTCAQMLQM